jgi:hypothetical protein
MSPTSPKTCTHDRGPGTTVCLRCRHDEWQASQRRRQQMLMRVLGLGFVVGIIGMAGVAMASTIRERSSGTDSTRNVVQQDKPAVARQPRQLTPTRSRTAEASPVDFSAPPVAPKAPAASVSVPASRNRAGSMLVEGRTELTDSIFAVRSGDSVVVNFDVQGGRTRRADKFERMLRTTLPLVYGRFATLALDSVPNGTLLPSKDIVGELQSQGMRLTLENGVKISVHPQTRIGRDGALVVAYLTVVER